MSLINSIKSWISTATDQILKVSIFGSTGNNVIVNDSGQLHVVLAGSVVEGNSSDTPLDADAVFMGEATNTLDYATYFVNVVSDQDSAIDGLLIQVSANGVKWYDDDPFTIEANKLKTFSFQCNWKFFRVKYTNGPVAQTDFTLHVVVKKTNSKASSHRILDPISGQDDAELVKSVLTGITEDGTFINASLTQKGNFKVAVQEYGDTPSIDAFARLRISEPFTLFDSKQLHDKQPLFWDEALAGSATSVHSSVNACTLMTVTANAADYVIRQTRQSMNYQPGKGQLIFYTFRAPQEVGCRKRMGYFKGHTTNLLDAVNGIFLEVTENEVAWCIAKNGVVTERITQENWNVDKLDGTGESLATLDLTATQIAILDFEWLGVGRVRCGLVIDGIIRYCHYFNHANSASFLNVYMSTPNLPLRYEISSDGTGGGTLDHICSTVISEGGIEKTGILRTVENAETFVTGYGTGNKYALIGIRLKTNYIDTTVIPESVALILDTNDAFKWELHLNPTVNGVFTYSDLTNSAIQFAQGTTTNTVATNGLIVGRGGGSTLSRGDSTALLTALRIGESIAGVEDTLVLVIRPFGPNLSVWSTLNFRELL